MRIGKGSRNTTKKTCPSAILSTTNLKCPELESSLANTRLGGATASDPVSETTFGKTNKKFWKELIAYFP
jgi:hypothetical protein